MEHSTEINEIAEALSKAQGEITGALKDSNNPFFKSKYADLAACWDACRSQLAENGLAVIQTTIERDSRVYVETILAHNSGQWFKGWLPVKTKDDGPQAQGSGITYARRYALAAMVGLAQIDDDAEAAQGRNVPVSANPVETLSEKEQQYVTDFARATREALSADQDESEKAFSILQLRDEMNESKPVFTAVWSLLNAKERKAFKVYCQTEKRAN